MDLLNFFTIQCLSKNGAVETIKWDNLLCFTIENKIFATASLDETPVGFCFKVTDEIFEQLTAEGKAIQAPYFAKRKWIKINKFQSFSYKELEELVSLSYQLVFKSLTKKQQAHWTQDKG